MDREHIISTIPLKSWDDQAYFSEEIKTEARHIFLRLIKRLDNIGEGLNEDSAMPHLRLCIEQFNDMQKEMRFYIDTQAREDILRFHHDITEAFGLQFEYGFADQWREW